MKYFRQFLLGRFFELHTDCSALVKIFGPKNDMGGCAAGRLNRWAASLMEFSFTVKHIKGSANKAADGLSRLPVVSTGSHTAPFPPVQSISGMQLPDALTSRPVVNEIDLVSSNVMGDVKLLSGNPSEHVIPYTIHQVVGDSPVAAWDIIPLSVKEVAAATNICKIYGKIFAL